MVINKNDPLLTSVRSALEGGMLCGADRVLSAFSGGADSTVLLYALSELASELGFELAAAHVDHMIRGSEADRDREFCIRTAEKLGIKLHVLREDVPALSEREKLSLEEAARNVRYGFFEQLMDEHGYAVTATAHHAGDNAETALFNLLRGTSPGKMGIPAVRGRYIRPLLTLSKKEILACCKRYGIEYVTDSTNAETEYTRNYIRHILLPSCERINPDALDSIARFCMLAKADSEYLDGEASKISGNADAGELASLPLPILSRYVRRRYGEVSNDTEMSFEQTNAVCDIIKRRSVGACVSLPGGVTFTLRREGLHFAVHSGTGRPKLPEKPVFSHTVGYGKTYIPETGDTVYICRNDEKSDISRVLENDIKDLINIYRLFIHKSVNSDKISKGVIVRSRETGDTVRIGNMTRRIKELYRTSHMTREETDRLPFFCDADGRIIWIPGFEAVDGYRAENGSDSTELYYFTGEKNKENDEQLV